MNLEDLITELTFKTSRSSGPGGQSVNKLNTKVELRFDVFNSQYLSEKEKEKISDALKNRITSEGILSITVQKSRSQLKNKREAIQKLLELITWSLIPEKTRIPVKPPASLNKKRLTEKKIQAEKKELRKPPQF